MYEHIVSLGWYCGVAASMSRYGFREMSGPFDWMFSDFEGVLHFLETSFEDFLGARRGVPSRSPSDTASV